MQRKTFWGKIRPKEIYSAKTSCSSKIPIPTLIIAQNNIHGFRLPEAWSPVSKALFRAKFILFLSALAHIQFSYRTTRRKNICCTKKSVSGEEFHRKIFSTETFCGSFNKMFAVFSPHISLPKIQGFLVFKFYIRYARSSLVHCEKENIGRIVSGGKQ